MQILFCTGLEEGMAQAPALTCRTAYQDDAYFYGKASHVTASWDQLVAGLASPGHRMRAGKCKFWAPLCDQDTTPQICDPLGGNAPEGGQQTQPLARRRTQATPVSVSPGRHRPPRTRRATTPRRGSRRRAQHRNRVHIHRALAPQRPGQGRRSHILHTTHTPVRGCTAYNNHLPLGLVSYDKNPPVTLLVTTRG